MISGYAPWFHEELKRRVEKDCVDRAVQLGQGMAGDFADYRYAVGFIAGQKYALDLAEEIKQETDRL